MRSFRQLFAGRTDCYGVYHPGDGSLRADGKNKGHGETRKGDLPDSMWEKHLSGKVMLGIVPVRLDGTVGWFASDIDIYSGLKLEALEKKCQEFDLPLVVCSTKSGGAHLYCFVNGAIPAGEAIALMKAWLEKLNQHRKAFIDEKLAREAAEARKWKYDRYVDLTRCEIFPKQETVAPDERGSWINIPYFNADNTDRYAIGVDGERLTLSEFEQLASARSIYETDLPGLKRDWIGKGGKKQKTKDPLDEAPPCVVRMLTDGIKEGGRNMCVTHIGVYLQKAYETDWATRLSQVNYTNCDPPMDHDELQHIIRSLTKKQYQYFCEQQPMASLCDKDACMSRKWGVGPQQGIDYGDFEIQEIVKIKSDPPIYIFTINGEEVRFTAEQIISPAKFKLRLFESLNLIISTPKKNVHESRVIAWMEKAKIEEAPDEIKTSGTVKEFFYEWIMTNVPKGQGGSKSIKKGLPAWIEEQQELVFRGVDFIRAFRDFQRGRIVSPTDIWDALRGMGCQSTVQRVDGDNMRLWKLKVDEVWFETPKGDAF